MKKQEVYENMINSVVRGTEEEFDAAKTALPNVLAKYSVSDVLTSLFIINLWLPNISSPVKLQFILFVFSSMDVSVFSTTNVVRSYKEFSRFYTEITSNLPTFMMLEDYVPEEDWGDIKYFYDDTIYNIFYGNEISNVTEYLTLFEMLYCKHEEQYFELTQKNPSSEFKSTLRLQNDIISSIEHQRKPLTNGQLFHGHLEQPSKSFWISATNFYRKYDVTRLYPQQFLDDYSGNLGNVQLQDIDYTMFHNLVFEGKLQPYLFLEHQSRYFMVHPRRYTSILFDSWSRIYKKAGIKVCSDKLPYSLSVGLQLHRFVKERINSDSISALVNIVDNNKLHDTTFSFSFIGKNILFLVYVLEPAYDTSVTESEIDKLVRPYKDVVTILESAPPKLFLNLDNQYIVFESKEGAKLTPKLVTIIPQSATDLHSISIPKDLEGYVIFMDSFLGIIDELENADMFASFLEYYEKHQSVIRLPLSLDFFGSYKNSSGVLIEGALEPDMIVLDPHWGTRLRFETLKSFWKIFPKVNFFDHPRTWKVEQETSTRKRLTARGYLGIAIYCKIGKSHLFINSPFDRMSYEQGEIANLLAESIEDTFSRNRVLLQKHKFFTTFELCQILIFPLSLIESDTFNHLRHLVPDGSYWAMDCTRRGESYAAIRMVFNDKQVTDNLDTVSSREIEIDLAVSVLRNINKFYSDNKKLNIIVKELKKQATQKPRFKIFHKSKQVAFPDFVDPWEPDAAHFKAARKILAEQALSCGLSPGYYQLDEAKSKINEIKARVIAIIDSTVSTYCYEKSVPQIISRIEAVIDRYQRSTYTIDQSLQHDVDYTREVNFAEAHEKFITFHKDYRYLLEKFVQISPTGKLILGKDDFQNLIALIDWLMVLYAASDSLHYSIHPVGMKVSDHYLIETVYEGNYLEEEQTFSEEQARQKLGLDGCASDDVVLNDDYEYILNNLDSAFKLEYGFTFRCLISTLKFLSQWPYHRDEKKESPYYRCSAEEIARLISTKVVALAFEEILATLKFITLNKEEVLRLVGIPGTSNDLPVWEHNKRFARYALRPLIRIGDEMCWGPHSVNKSASIWSGNVTYGTLPVETGSKRIEDVLRSIKQDIERRLVSKGEEILRRYTRYIRTNCELCNLPPKGTHPRELGDYDILAYIPEKKLLLNIECKDILPVFCLKDAKRLREKIFGREGKNDGHISPINRRQAYLSSNYHSIIQTLGWPSDGIDSLEIIPVYLTRMLYWWTRFPPIATDIKFVELSMLSNFVEGYKQQHLIKV